LNYNKNTEGYDMRRKDREITDRNQIMDIMKKCNVCSLALFDEGYPYIIPFNFGAAIIDDQIKLYFHCAKAGKKLDLIRKNNKVGFEMNCSHKLLLGEKACDSTMEFESVCGNGSIEILTEDKKEMALNYLMKQYTQKENHEFDTKVLAVVEVLELTVNEIYGKALKRS
jgi:Predicted flavin-nucleotide-binding protein